jgi:hypothetical protein
LSFIAPRRGKKNLRKSDKINSWRRCFGAGAISVQFGWEFKAINYVSEELGLNRLPTPDELWSIHHLCDVSTFVTNTRECMPHRHTKSETSQLQYLPAPVQRDLTWRVQVRRVRLVRLRRSALTCRTWRVSNHRHHRHQRPRWGSERDSWHWREIMRNHEKSPHPEPIYSA